MSTPTLPGRSAEVSITPESVQVTRSSVSSSLFPDAELSPWVERLRELTGADAAGARPAYVYFNNDNHGHAAFNALTLRRMAETEA